MANGSIDALTQGYCTDAIHQKHCTINPLSKKLHALHQNTAQKPYTELLHTRISPPPKRNICLFDLQLQGVVWVTMS